MMDRSGQRLGLGRQDPRGWIGQEVMIETTEVLSSDLRASAPVPGGCQRAGCRHAGDAPPRPESVFPLLLSLRVVGWIRLAEEDEREEEPRAADSS